MKLNELKQDLTIANSNESKELLKVLTMLLEKHIVLSFCHYDVIYCSYGIIGFSATVLPILNSKDFEVLLSTGKFFTLDSYGNDYFLLKIYA